MANEPTAEPLIAPSAPIGTPSIAQAMDKLPNDVLRAAHEQAVKDRLHPDTVAAYAAALARRQAQPIDLVRQKEADAFGIAETPKPADYHAASFGDLGRDWTPEQVGRNRTELGEWAGAMGFSKETGVAIIERLARIGHEINNTDRQGWAEKAEREAIASLAANYRSELPAKREDLARKDFADLKSAAAEVLKRAPGEFTTNFLKSPQFNDLWTLKTLVIHGKALQLMKARWPK